MPKVRFNLQNPKQNPARIRLVFRYDRQRLVYYTGDQVPPDCFNSKTGRMRRSATCRNADEINEGLRRLEAECERIYLQYRNAGEALPPELFRRELDAFWKGRTLPAPSGVDLFSFIGQLIAERAANLAYSKHTVKTYRTVLNKLRAYQAETGRAVWRLWLFFSLLSDLLQK